MFDSARIRVAQWLTRSPSIAEQVDALNSGSAVTRGTVSDRSDNALLKAYGSSPPLHAAVKKIAENFAAIEWTLSVARRKADGKPMRSRARLIRNYQGRRNALARLKSAGQLEQLDVHPLLDLFDRGSPLLDGFSTFQVLQSQLDLVGDAFLLKGCDTAGRVVSLWPIPATWITTMPSVGDPYWRINMNGSQMEIPEGLVVWIKDPNPYTPYGRGSSSAAALADELDSDEYAAQFVRAFFENHGVPSTIIGFEGASADSVQAVAQKWNNEHRGPRKSHGVKFVDGKPWVAKVSAEFTDREVTELRRFFRDEVNQQFGIPPEILGILESSNKATIDAAENIFARWVLVPRAERVRIALQRQLIDPVDPNLILGYVSPVPDDREHRLATMTESPHNFTRDQWQETAGYEVEPDTPGGDVLLIPNKLVPVHAAELGDAADSTEEVWPAPVVEPPPAKALLPGAASWRRHATRAPDLFDVEQAIAALTPVPLVEATDHLMADELKTWGTQALADLGSELSFSMVNPAVVAHLAEYNEHLAISNATTERQLRAALTESVQIGEGMIEASKRVAKVFDEARSNRSDLIAWTETNRSSNFGNYHAMQVSGLVDQKQWLNAGDHRVRSTHRTDQVVAIGANFTLSNNASGLYPGDMDAYEENLRCRCSTVPVFAASYSKADDAARIEKIEELRAPWRAAIRNALSGAFSTQQSIVASIMSDWYR